MLVQMKLADSDCDGVTKIQMRVLLQKAYKIAHKLEMELINEQ